MSKSAQAQVIVATGAVGVTVGVYGLADWPLAALVAGVQAIGYGLALVDVDEPTPQESRRVIERGRR